MTKLFKGHYVTLYELKDGKLRMKINTGLEGEYREDVLAEYVSRGEDCAVAVLFEDMTANGWKIFEPDEMASLTDSLMFGQEYEYDSEIDDIVKNVGRVYYNNLIGSKSFLQILLDRGYYDFKFVRGKI
jgi:hypothetical protein